ncbi:MAG: hypothetical protein LBS55_07055 [Prevotellaceae bacterium]|jgi:hypothetical protein|nr:hypothetical protein [Prevotellaceae bacterium]
MKVNKKAILATLVTMIMSLGIMGGINGNSQDSSVQQLTGASAYFAATAESAVYRTAWTLVTAVGYDVTKLGVATTISMGWNPLGWTAGGLTLISGL